MLHPHTNWRMFPSLTSNTQLAHGCPAWDIPEKGSPSDVISKRSTIVALVLFTLKLYNKYIANFTDQTGINYHIRITITLD